MGMHTFEPFGRREATQMVKSEPHHGGFSGTHDRNGEWTDPTISGWWFGTWLLWLSIQLGISIHPNWRSPSFFQRGRSTTNQYITIWSGWIWSWPQCGISGMMMKWHLGDIPSFFRISPYFSGFRQNYHWTGLWAAPLSFRGAANVPRLRIQRETLRDGLIWMGFSWVLTKKNDDFNGNYIPSKMVIWWDSSGILMGS